MFGDIVGFLKFLNRGKKTDSLEDLDLPPAPPPLEGSGGHDMPDFPDLDSDKGFSMEQQQPEMDLPPQAPKQQDLPNSEMPDFPQLPDFEELHEPNMDIPPISMPDGGFEDHEDLHDYSMPLEEEKPMAEEQPLLDDFEIPKAQKPQDFSEPLAQPIQRSAPVIEKKRLFAPRNDSLSQQARPESLYIRVDKFRTILGSVNTIRGDLKKYENSIGNLQNISNSKNASSEKIKLMLNDLQKKIIFIDRTLFKGGD